MRSYCMILCAVAALSVVAAEEEATETSNQPHLVLILVDELGSGDVPWFDFDIHAPTIKELGETGLRLGTSYAWMWCAPTRGALLSGRFPMHTGYDGGGMPGNGQGMPLDVPLLGEDLKRAGYATHMLGKWHLGFRTPSNLPINRGFDSYFGLLGGGADHYNKVEEGNTCSSKSNTSLPFRVDFFENDKPATELWDNSTYDAFQYSSRAVELVNTHNTDDPFFLYWAPHKVHSPLQVDGSFLGPYPLDPGGKCQSTPDTCVNRGYGPGCGCDEQCYCNRRVLRGMISAVDSMLKNLTTALKGRGMWDNTIIVFLGDNGGPVNNAASNSIFKGMKFGHYEGGHRVPTFLSGGGLNSSLSGKWHNATTHLVDLHATIIDLASAQAASPPNVYPVDGYTLGGVLNGSLPLNAKIRDELWIANDVLRMGDWKLITKGGAGAPTCMLGIGGKPVPTPHDPSNLTTLSGSSTCHGDETGVDHELCLECKCPSMNISDSNCHACLYNVVTDPGEQVNLAQSNTDQVNTMHARLRVLQATTVTPKWPPNDVAAACDVMSHKYGGFFGPWAET